MKKEYQIEESEFASHMRTVFEPHHYESGHFVFSKDALKHGLDTLSYDSFEIELALREEAPYFSGKFTIQETLRKMQALASMLSIALEKYDL